MADILNPFPISRIFLNRLDPRSKLLLLFLSPLFFLQYSTPVLLILLPILITGVVRSGLNPFKLLKSSYGFLLLILLPPLSAGIRHYRGLPGTVPSAAVALSVSLLAIYCTGILLIRTTGIRGLQNATTWLVSFLPFLPARKAGLLIGLTFTTLPRILADWERIRDAQKTRGGDRTGNILRRAALPLLTLLLNSIFRAEITAGALEARGYPEKETGSGKETRRLLSLYWGTCDTLFVILTLLLLIMLCFL